MAKTVGIIGAGISGLTLGVQLQARGFQVELFDKGRSVGGRASSRRTDWGYLDHGAQYFTIRDPEFRAFLETHLPANGLLPWQVEFGRFESNQMHSENLDQVRYVPRQAMSTLCKQLATNLLVRTQVKICRLQPQTHWLLEDENNNQYGPFDQIVVTAPPAQTAELIGPHSHWAIEMGQIQMWPCWSLMLVTDHLVPVPFGGVKCNHPVLGWIGLNHTKPERGILSSLIVQANWHWSAENLEQDREIVGDILQKSAEQLLGMKISNSTYRSVHLWRYAAPVTVASQPYFLDSVKRLAVCGDWCVAGKVEGAFLSANALAKQMWELESKG